MPVVKVENREINADGKTFFQIAEELGVKNAVVVKFNGKLVDLKSVPEEDGTAEFITFNEPEGLEVLRHSASHLMAQALTRLYPGVKFGVGPAIKDGFYYDVELPDGQKLSDEDLPKIEEEMRKIVEEDVPVERKVLPKEEAIKMFEEMGQVYKVELLKEIEDNEVSIYSQGEFTDLCRGPHIPSTGFIPKDAFKLLNLAGAYWKGIETNPMLQRIYGTVFPNRKELKKYLNWLEEVKKRDHRKLGKDMKLFSFHEEAPAMPFWKPRGVILKNILIDYMRGLLKREGYIEIQTPTILRRELWVRSGHWDNYSENMFFAQAGASGEALEYAVKPMNCPGGMLMYREEVHSYRELPLRVAEFGLVHRYEKSGVLQGLFRVRAFTQDDAHIFMLPSQIKDEVLGVIRLMQEVYEKFDFTYSVELSTRPEKSIGTDEQWETATNGLRNALEESGLPYEIREGEGAFYGPKIDFHLQDAIGRTHQCGTIQLDMALPERFDLTYRGEDGKDHRVVMIHRAIFGSIERFMGILLEHYAGKLPLWLSPVQVVVIPVTTSQNAYAEKVADEIESAGFRVEVDLRNERIGYKIRNAQIEKIPYMVVVGQKEVESRKVSVRHRDRGEIGVMVVSELIEKMKKEL